MKYALWIGVPLAALLLLGAVLALVLRRCYRIAFVRDRDFKLDINLLGAPWTAYLDDVRAGMDWLEEHTAERAQIASADGLTLSARVVPRENARGTALLCHGYRSLGCLDFSCMVEFYYEQGLNLVVIDERACGESEGDTITFGLRERQDVADWLNWIGERFGREEPVVLGGVSMGASTVLMSLALGLPDSVRGVIADCGYTSPWAQIAYIVRRDYHLPPFPLVYMVNAMFRRRTGCDLREADTVSALRGNDRVPVFFIHGGADDFVPTDFTRENYAACAAEKELLIVPGAGHAVSVFADGKAYRAGTAAFLDRVLPTKK